MIGLKFQDYHYERPNLEKVKDEFYTHIQTLQTTTDVAQGLAAIKAVQSLQDRVYSMMTLTYIRKTIDNTDPFYEAEQEFWDEHSPVMGEWDQDYLKAVLNSSLRPQFEEHLPATFFALAENSFKSFKPSIIPLLQEENKLGNEYSKLVASAKIEYKGQTYNLSSIGPFKESTNREERREVSNLVSQFFADNQDEFDRIYDEMVKVRTKIAHELGFKDFVELGYVRMNRLDYTREDVEVYRNEIKQHVVPVVTKLYERQRQRVGLDSLKYYDLRLAFPKGNAKPIGTPEEILANGVKMYHEMSPETAEFMDMMVERELLDLVSKSGKEPGGYCTYLPLYQSPFIFSNFNGTSGDVDVLTHEAGHAFQVYQSRWIPAQEVLWPTTESCEIHSMSMEFFAWKWMDLFFGEQADKYKFNHLFSSLNFLPYGVLVDHFQHEVYENPNLTPQERRQLWRRLEREYLPYKDYDGNPFFETGGFWFQQGHIFEAPFYYIDYTLAQVCAFQFWKRSQVDHDSTAWADYLEICRVGGTQSFLQILETAHLKSPFGQGNLEEVIGTIRDYLDNVSEESLNI